MSVTIPEAYRDLLDKKILAILATTNRDGSPQASPVWFLYDGTHIVINTARGRLKDRNMTARPQVSLVFPDPDDLYRYMEIRGVVEEVDEASGLDVINTLCERYTGNPVYYSWSSSRQGSEQRVTYKIKPTRVICH